MSTDQKPAGGPRVWTMYWVTMPDGNLSLDCEGSPPAPSEIIIAVEKSYADRLEQELADVRKERDEFWNALANIPNDQKQIMNVAHASLVKERDQALKELADVRKQNEALSTRFVSKVEWDAQEAEIEKLQKLIMEHKEHIVAYRAQAAALAGALEKCQQPDGQAGIDDAELFEQYFTHVEPQPMGTPKTIFRLGHAQGMANLARLTRKALAAYREFLKGRE